MPKRKTSISKPASPAAILHRAMIQILRGLRREDSASAASPARLSALSVLAFGGPLSLSQLAAVEQIEPPTASRLVRDLERAGWVTRCGHATDGRAILLDVTPAGRALMQAGRQRRVNALEAAVRQLTARDRAILERAASPLARLAGALQAQRKPATPKRAARGLRGKTA